MSRVTGVKLQPFIASRTQSGRFAASAWAMGAMWPILLAPLTIAPCVQAEALPSEDGIRRPLAAGSVDVALR